MTRLLAILALAWLSMAGVAAPYLKVPGNLSQLLTNNPNDVTQSAFITGTTTVADGGQSIWTYVANSVAATNASNIFAPLWPNPLVPAPVGRWFFQMGPSGGGAPPPPPGVSSNLVALTVNSIADMVALTPVAGVTNALVLNYYAGVPGGGGLFSYNPSSSATTNLGNTFKPLATTGRWLRAYTGVADVREWGARGNGVSDDITNINAAISYSFSLGDSQFLPVYFPPGVYGVGSTILHTNSGNYVKIYGAGTRATRITALAAFPNLFSLVNVLAPVNGRKTVTGITFDGRGKATNLVFAPGLTQSIIADCEFAYVATNGYGMVINGHTLRISRNEFTGFHTNDSTIQASGIYISSGVLNGVVIDQNNFNNCYQGIQCDTHGYDLDIRDNVFDTCVQGGVELRLGAALVTIQNNYFEACGTSPAIVQTGVSTFENWYGAVVAHGRYDALSQTENEKLVIVKNEFANCSPDSFVSVGNITGGVIRDNQANRQYGATNFVNLRGNGSPYTSTKKVWIEHTSFAGQFTNILGFNTASASQNQSSLVVVDNGQDGFSRIIPDISSALGNPVNWPRTGVISVGKDASITGLFPAWTWTGSAFFQTSISLTNTLAALKGQYLRVNALTKGAAGHANGITFTVTIDGTVVLTQSSPLSTDWTSLLNPVFRVPPSATNITLKIVAEDTSNPVWMRRFAMTVASRDLDGEVSNDSLLQLASTPTYGTWAVGDAVLNSNPASGTNYGWVCTVAGSPGTWLPFGSIGGAPIGTGTAPQIAVWSSATGLTGYAGLQFDNGNSRVLAGRAVQVTNNAASTDHKGWMFDVDPSTGLTLISVTDAGGLTPEAYWLRTQFRVPNEEVWFNHTLGVDGRITNSTLTTNSLVFADSAKVLTSQTNFVVDASNHYLGINTWPTVPLSVVGDASITGTATISGSGTWDLITGKVKATSWEFTTGGQLIVNGTGSPEGVTTAPAGSLYINRSGGWGTSQYVKTNGSGNTGWSAIATISSGGGGGITGSGSAGQATYWTGSSTVAGSAGRLWDDTARALFIAGATQPMLVVSNTAASSGQHASGFYVNTSGNFRMDFLDDSGATSQYVFDARRSGTLYVGLGTTIENNLTVDGGNLTFTFASKGIYTKTGTNARKGTVTLSSGAATVTNSSIQSTDIVFFTCTSASGTIGAHPHVTSISAGASFVVAAGASDNSTYTYWIMGESP